MELTAAEENALIEIQKVYLKGEPVDSFISQRLYGDMAHIHEDIAYSAKCSDPLFLDLYSTYALLADKGILLADKTAEGVYVFGNLTPYGARYFEIDKKAKKEKLKERWGQRVFTIAMSALVFVLNFIVSKLV